MVFTATLLYDDSTDMVFFPVTTAVSCAMLLIGVVYLVIGLAMRSKNGRRGRRAPGGGSSLAGSEDLVG